MFHWKYVMSLFSKTSWITDTAFYGCSCMKHGQKIIEVSIWVHENWVG